jgi:hypothetical protein
MQRQNKLSGTVPNIIEQALTWFEPCNQYCVEIGTKFYKNMVTKKLLEKEWKGIGFDKKKNVKNNDVIQIELITAENVNDIMDKYEVPNKIGVLSIDIDGNDFYVWKSFNRYADLVAIEYNGILRKDEDKVIEYNPEFDWDGTAYFGASLLALNKLAELKNYILVGTDNIGSAALFIHKFLIGKIPETIPHGSMDKIWRRLKYKHKPDKKKREYVSSGL